MSELERSIREKIRLKMQGASVPGSEMLEIREIREITETRAMPDVKLQPGESLFLVKVRTSAPVQEPRVATSARMGRTSDDRVYAADGKVNVAFLLRNAQILLQAKDYQLARNIFQTLLKSRENQPEALLGLARCLEGMGQLDEARARYEESIAFRPTTEAFSALASLLLREGKTQSAIEILERVLKTPDLDKATAFEFHKTLGNACFGIEDFAKAEKQYQNALDCDPAADDIRTNLGLLHLRTGRIPEAKASFEDAVSAFPQNAQAQFGLGCVAMIGKDWITAMDHFILSLESDLNNPRAVFYLIRGAYETKQFARAEPVVSRFSRHGAVSPSLLYAVAGIQYHAGKRVEATETVERLLRIQPLHRGGQELWSLLKPLSGRTVEDGAAGSARTTI
jgi:tetratricopeptide (TPR) repeat protein